MNNQFNEAMDEAEEEQTEEETAATGVDVEEYLDSISEGPKTETCGFAVTEYMKRFHDEFKQAEDVDVELAESFRDHLENLAHRHPEVAERAAKKLAIDRGEL